MAGGNAGAAVAKDGQDERFELISPYTKWRRHAGLSSEAPIVRVKECLETVGVSPMDIATLYCFGERPSPIPLPFLVHEEESAEIG